MDAGSLGGAALSVSDSSMNTSLLAKVGGAALPQEEQRSSKPLMSVGLMKCEECGRGFSDISVLLRHQQREHALRKPHRCPTCGQSFALLSSLHLHRRIHAATRYKWSSQGGSPRQHAARSDRSEGRLFGHRRNLQGGGPYACAPCGRAFSHKPALLHHQQAGCQHPTEPEEPQITQLTSTASPAAPTTQHDEGLLSQSKPSATNPASMTSQVLPVSAQPTTPQGPAHSSLSSPTDSSSPPHASPPPSPTRPYFCSLCHRTFNSQVGLSSHQRLSHPVEWKLAQVTYWNQGGKKFPCSSCEKVFCHAASLYQHKRRCFGTQADETGAGLQNHKGQRFPCRSCDMVFSQTSSLLLHRKEQHSRPARPRDRGRMVTVLPKRRTGVHPCPFCSKVFSHHLPRWAHVRAHHAQQQLQRKRCHKVDYHKANKQEIAKKLFRCSQCNKAYRSRGNLLKHHSTHAKAGRRSRTVHRKPGRRKNNRGKSEPQSSEEEMYSCPFCEEVFSQLSSLREHELVHQPMNTARSCSVCQHSMGSARGAESDARVYHCEPCQRTFRLLQVFLQHCQMHLVPLGDRGPAGDLDIEDRGVVP
ncbi:zinc finger protein 271 [Scleropages formosus]|uniref:Zinc finger protein 271-like n=1 Tax=Scleropages formosus TaxID=113540 RepID=A0A8C9V6I7_SCLFO|nr:zinc finger protein 271-like [Scleropages formosus]XP_018613936.1 zinc finger protein 271-like [Scleropages formosus]